MGKRQPALFASGLVIAAVTLATVAAGSAAPLGVAAKPAASSFEVAVDPSQEPSDVARDVPYVPTRDAVVEAMLRLANVGPEDVVIDLGSGDGRIVIAAARDRGARGIGVEIDPALVAFSREAAFEAGVADRVEFRVGNLFEADLSDATVIAIFLGVDENRALRPRLLAELDPGDRVVSNTFTMGEWRPDRRLEIARLPVAFFVYAWDIPAQANGRWEWSTPIAGTTRRYTARFLQHFQELNVGVFGEGSTVTVRESTLSGDRVVIEIVDATADADGQTALMRYEGRVTDDGMLRGEVVISLGGEVRTEPWTARREGQD